MRLGFTKSNRVQCRYGGETECLAYVTTANKWVPLADLPVAKVNATTCPSGLLDRDRSIIIAGGRDMNGRPTRSGIALLLAGGSNGWN